MKISELEFLKDISDREELFNTINSEQAEVIKGGQVTNINGTNVEFLPNTDLPGNDLRNISTANADQCAQACVGDAGCIAFTYNQSNDNCFLKSAVATSRVSNNIATSGIKQL